MSMSRQEIERTVKQLDNDTQAIHEILVDLSAQQKSQGNRLAELDLKIDGVEERLTARIDGVDTRLTGIDTWLGSLQDSTAEILRRLPG